MPRPRKDSKGRPYGSYAPRSIWDTLAALDEENEEYYATLSRIRRRVMNTLRTV